MEGAGEKGPKRGKTRSREKTLRERLDFRRRRSRKKKRNY